MLFFIAIYAMIILMKRQTHNHHIQIANDILYYIYTHIESNIDIDELSQDLRVSKYHMQRIYKEIFGRNIYESIKSIRLQKASNLLLTNRFSTINQIAQMCGYSSQTAFIRVFKERFSMTPGEWRSGGYLTYSKKILAQSKKATRSTMTFDHLYPTIVKMPVFHSYYIRHKGYSAEIKQTWQKIQTWLLTNNIEAYTQIGLFHDNPTITPLSECHYVACVVPDKKYEIESERLPYFKVSDGIYAKFELTGEQGDLLKFIHWVYHVWLPQSEYETSTKPSYVMYRKNNYLEEDMRFDLSFYISIRY